MKAAVAVTLVMMLEAAMAYYVPLGPRPLQPLRPLVPLGARFAAPGLRLPGPLPVANLLPVGQVVHRGVPVIRSGFVGGLRSYGARPGLRLYSDEVAAAAAAAGVAGPATAVAVATNPAPAVSPLIDFTKPEIFGYGYADGEYIPVVAANSREAANSLRTGKYYSSPGAFGLRPCPPGTVSFDCDNN